MAFSLGYYEGVSITVDLHELEDSCPEILKEAGFDPNAVYRKFHVENSPFGVPSNHTIDSVFSLLHDLPEQLHIPYYKLKAQEALLQLLQIEPNAEKQLTH